LSQIIEGRVGCSAASSVTGTARWVVSTTPAMRSGGMSVLAHSCRQAAHRCCQKASGAHSIQPGSGER